MKGGSSTPVAPPAEIDESSHHDGRQKGKSDIENDEPQK
jgi:hypothetical protein